MSDTKKVKARKIKVSSTKGVVSEENQDNILYNNATKVKARKIKNNVSVEITENVNQEFVENKINLEKSVNSSKNRKKVKARKIKMTYTDKEEKELDKAIENEDNLSITVMIIILILCFIVGIFLGYVLYRIAINSSNVMMIVRYFLK